MLDTINMDPNAIDNVVQDIRSYTFLMNMINASTVYETDVPELQGHDWYNNMSFAFNGMMGMFKDKTTDKYLFLKAQPLGRPTLYNDWTQYLCTAANGQTFRVNSDDIVICYDNTTRMPVTANDVIDTANRIAEIQRTADSRLFRHKNPLILAGNKKMQATWNRFIKQLSDNYKAIMIDDGSDLQSGIRDKMLTDINFINNDLLSYKENLIQECLGRHGINYNPAGGKKERLLVDEINSNNDQILLAREAYITPKREFCEKVKERFGINYKIEFNPNSLYSVVNNDKQEDNNYDDVSRD